jgi:hypothetical protein
VWKISGKTEADSFSFRVIQCSLNMTVDERWQQRQADICFLGVTQCVVNITRTYKRLRQRHAGMCFVLKLYSAVKIRAFWDIALCSLRVDRRFRGVYCLHRQDDEFSWNVINHYLRK